MAAETEQHSAVPANGNTQSNNIEAAAALHDDREQRRKQRTKLIIYIALFLIIQTAIITIFDMTVMKLRTPKFRLTAATLANFNPGSAANPSLRATMNAEFSVKNTNFGRFKYDNTTVEFFYRGDKVGEVLVPESRANWRSTREFRVDVDLNLVNGRSNSQLSSDLSAGVVPITSAAKMEGRVDLIFVLRKNRSAYLKCAMEIVTEAQQIGSIVCDS